MKTDNHYKICLEREKRKVAQLKGIISKFQTKNKDICFLVDKTLSNLKKETFTTEKERKMKTALEDIRMRLVLISTPQK